MPTPPATGTILALPHMGNWDHAGAWLVLTGVPFTTVAERLKPAELYDLFVAFREGLGFEVLAASGDERPPFEVLVERLQAGGMLCLLADRDLTPSGVPVTFFGPEATMPAGPAALALRTGAALIPTTLWYEGDAVNGAWGALDRGRPSPHTDVATMTQDLADVFAMRQLPPILPIGTCCNGSGTTISIDVRRSTGPVGPVRRRPVAGSPRAHRFGLPVHLGRSGWRTGARARSRRNA